MCYRHYIRWRKYGDPTVLKRPKSWGDAKCAVTGCEESVEARGWCNKHYQRWKTHGSPATLARRERGTGSVTANGYLIVTDHGHPLENARGVFAHRAALLEKIGPGIHDCTWCGRSVSWDLTWPDSADALVVDHLDHDGLNNDPGNLAPSCGQCNLERSATAG